MAIRKIIPLGDPRLKKKSKPIRNIKSPKTKKLIRDLKDTMRKADLVGIAAPQIGENYQVFLTEPRKTDSRTDTATDKQRVFINPKITFVSKTEHYIYEGCGCTGGTHGVFGPVKRAKTITIQAFDEKGNKFQITADGLLGRVFLHEMDHLNGIEFIDRIQDNKTLVLGEYYIKHLRNSKQNVQNSKITKLVVKSF